MKDRIHKLINSHISRLRQQFGSEFRLWVFFLEPFSETVEICWPLKQQSPLSDGTSALVSNCFKRQRSILIHDSRVDPLLGSTPDGDFRSALVVPIFDSDQTMMGLIYLDHPEPGRLEKEERLEIERVARTLSAKIPRWSNPTVQAPNVPSISTFDLRGALLAGALMLFFAVGWALAPSTPQEKRASLATASPTLTPAPKTAVDTVRSFVTLLDLQDEEQAWLLLSAEAKNQWPKETFVQLCKTWLSDSQNRWELPKRQLVTAKVEGSSATVHLEALDPENPTWTILLSWENQEWVIDSLEGIKSFER